MNRENTGRRKLAAILSADVAGYSRLMGEDEHATVHRLTACRAVFADLITQHAGRVVDTAGDSVLAEFGSVVEAVQCAVELQRELADRNAQLPETRQMVFRIGVNLGDVIEQADGSIYGDGVNIAARLQALAQPGGICISGTAYDQIENKLPFEYEYLGEQLVKNIARPVRAYRVLSSPRPAASRVRRVLNTVIRPWPKAVLAIAAIVVLAGAGATIWYVSVHRLPPLAEVSPQRSAFESGKPSIAVLAFVNMSGDQRQEYFSDGITEDIIAALTRFTKLSVVARNSTFAYKGKPMDVRQLGKELKVRYIVEGSVRRSQDRARVTVQLIDASDGKHIWAEFYDRDLKDLFSLQDEVTRQVVGRLDVELDRAQLEHARRSPPKDFRAYDLVLQARKLVYQHSVANHRESRDLLERAVAMDDRLAAAYIELSWVYLDEFRFGWNPRAHPLDRALNAASRAVELDPNNGFAHWRLAKILFFRKELDRFEAEMQRALALNPNHAETLADVAIHLSVLDRTEEAYGYAQRAAKLDPELTWVYFVHTHYFYRRQRYREALAAAHQINIPEFYFAHFWRALPYAQLGEMDGARKEAAEVLRLKPDFAWMDEVEVWNVAPAFAAHAADGARKAGIPVNRRAGPEAHR